MKSPVPVLLLISAIGGTALGEEERAAAYAIRSLNAPDPIFVTSGDSVDVRVTAVPPGAIRSARIALDGRDVTGAFSLTAPGELTGTVSGLRPGINTFEVLEGHRGRRAVARLNVARARAPVLACNAGAFASAVLPVPDTAITSVAPVAATPTVPAHCLVTGTIDAGRVGYPSSPGAPVGAYTYAISWAARLPDAWNGKFFMPGAPPAAREGPTTS